MAMTLQAKRLRGDQFTANDLLEVSFNADGNEIKYLVLTLVQVSGVTATHGGGGSAGDYLHYKPLPENEGDAIDYTTQEMWVEQTEKGTSVIKVKAEIYTVADYNAFQTAYDEWVEAGEVEGDRPEETKSYLETGEITLQWSDDSLV